MHIHKCIAPKDIDHELAKYYLSNASRTYRNMTSSVSYSKDPTVRDFFIFSFFSPSEDPFISVRIYVLLLLSLSPKEGK